MNSITTFFSQPTSRQKKIERAAITVVKYAAYGLATAGILYCAGHALDSVGLALQSAAKAQGLTFSAKTLAMCGHLFRTAGLTLAYCGRALFLFIAVPIYTITYQLPKWIITEGIPQLCLLSQKAAIAVVEWASEAFATLYTHVFVPLTQVAEQLAKWTWTHIAPMFERLTSVCERLMKLADKVIDTTLQTLLDVARYTVQLLDNTIGHVVRTVFHEVGHFLNQALHMSWSVIAPVLNQIGSACDRLGNFAIKVIINVGAFLYQVSRQLLQLLDGSIGRYAREAFRLLGQAADFVGRHLWDVVSTVTRELIIPILEIIARSTAEVARWAFNLIYEVVKEGILPVLSVIQEACMSIFHEVVVPLGLVLWEVGRVAAQGASLAAEGVQNACNLIITATSDIIAVIARARFRLVS